MKEGTSEAEARLVHEEGEEEDRLVVGGQRRAEQRLPALLEERRLPVDAEDRLQRRGDLGEHLIGERRDDADGGKEV